TPRASKAAPPPAAPRKSLDSMVFENFDEPSDKNPAPQLVVLLHGLMKAVLLHDEKHSVARRAAEALCQAVSSVPPPFVLQFVAGGVFLDRTLVPLDFSHFERCQE